jgi:hypothetical protein
MTFLQELQAVKLNPVSKKEDKPLANDNSLSNKLQALLDARREQLNRNCGSSDSEDDEDSDDSSGFD